MFLELQVYIGEDRDDICKKALFISKTLNIDVHIKEDFGTIVVNPIDSLNDIMGKYESKFHDKY